MRRFYYILCLLLPLLITVGCTDEVLYDGNTDSVTGKLSYDISLDDHLDSRAISDGKEVNQLKVGVFQDNVLITTKTVERNGEEKFSVNDITLLKDLEYRIVFWAEAKNNGIYKLDEETFKLVIDYSQYQNLSLAETELFEAFYAIDSVCLKNDNNAKSIELTRPFGQLNIAAKEEDVFEKVKSASFIIDKIYTGFDLLTGKPVGESSEQTFSFKYSTQDVTDKQSIEIGEDLYYYVASAYLLTPETVKLTGGLYSDGNEPINSFDFDKVQLKANYRTNIYGEMIQIEAMKPWDGITFTKPTDEGLTCQVNIEGATNVFHIDTPEELAYCMKYDYPTGYDAIHICGNHHMGNHNWDNVANVPSGIIIEGTSADGNLSHIISNVKLQGTTTGLFGDAEDLKVSNLQLKDFEVNTASDMAGVLAGTVKGNSSFANVVIDGCTVVADYGKAGGMVGSISRKSEKDRAETLSVSFSGCQVNNSTISAKNTEGIFVGEFSGYDNQETLSFDAECSAENTSITDYISSYLAENQSVWLDAIEPTYDNWLGTETYRRGVVKFEGKRLVPKWDGKTTVEPLLANAAYDGANAVAGANKFVVYSPFDLAGVREKTASPAAIYFKSDVDMNGMGKDGIRATPLPMRDESEVNDDYLFDAFSSIKTLDGNNFTLYNLSVEETHDGYSGAAFIKGASGDTEHKNLTIQNADIKNYHDPKFPKDTEGNAYAGTLVSTVEGTYKSSNITIKGGNVFAICKMGGLYGRIASGTATIDNCKVDGTTISNYDSGYNDTFLDTKILNIPVVIDFHSDGEVGGLIGFITGNATITNCTVENCNFYCTGENDWELNVLIAAAKVPGRHVNQFIGDIRTDSGETITISNYKMTNNNMHSTETSLHGEKFRASDKYKEFKVRSPKTWDCVGFVYAVTIMFDDVPGTVKINNNTVMVSESMRK